MITMRILSFSPAGKMCPRHVGVTGSTKYGVFDENASGASFIETGILKTSTKTFVEKIRKGLSRGGEC